MIIRYKVIYTMYDLFNFLYEIECDYSRTIFNFHLMKNDGISDIYGKMKELISNETIFNNVVKTEYIRSHIKKLVYCDINITKHIINNNVYDNIVTKRSNHNFKCSQFFDIKSGTDELSRSTVKIFEHDRSSLVSYIRTTNKKRKVDYGEIKKTVHGSSKTPNYFSGKKSDDYLITTIKSVHSQPWIKTITKRMRIDIINNSIVTKGKSSILQTIEVVFVNRTCIKIFKDSTMHIILSKDKMETGSIGIINKLFKVYEILFHLLHDITNETIFKKIFDISLTVLSATTFDEKMNQIKINEHEYGISNFGIGMFNLTYIKPISFTVFPSLLEDNNKIKFFKGKKLNIVAIRSLKDCKYYVSLSNSIMKNMEERSNILNEINIESVCIEKIKELLI
ncbi:intermediate transcription factor VITF-3 [Deerpox virus W-1170-84]|uniref:Intermediate transcription factor 3 large subunit n=1 Tax=Deerpox virus (strain W-1170-84) TaxID=305676 RepID=Q08F58_DPV84|nr:intermediate transcription factor VITF-3 [Deerpox virus W-1170-84]AUI80685.1 intermediate transcription factor VITF-3 [White-tailed deer poxvirus]